MIILQFILISILVFLGTTFLGYIVHWAIHQKWSGLFYRAHCNHHELQYPAFPAYKFLSDTYRDAGKDNTVYYFILLFLPILSIFPLLSFFGYLPIWMSISIILEMLLIGQLHNYLHDQIHLSKPKLDIKYINKLRYIHYIHHESHHYNHIYNFGIFYFIWDKLFKTYQS